MNNPAAGKNGGLRTKRWTLRLHVLVKSEKIFGIKFALDRHQSIIIFAIGGSHAFVAFIAQVVYVHTIHPKRPKNRVHFTRPGNIFFVSVRITPD